MTFGAHELDRSKPFLLHMQSLTISTSAKQRRAENKLYRCTSVFSAGRP